MQEGEGFLFRLLARTVQSSSSTGLPSLPPPLPTRLSPSSAPILASPVAAFGQRCSSKIVSGIMQPVKSMGTVVTSWEQAPPPATVREGWGVAAVSRSLPGSVTEQVSWLLCLTVTEYKGMGNAAKVLPQLAQSP